MPELSGLEVLVLLKEIGNSLRGTYVNNIFSFGSSQLLRLRKQGSDDILLVVSRKKGVWVSKKVNERAETGKFTTELRRLLERAKFKEAAQVDLDRVFQLTFEGSREMKLTVELMPPGNVIVTDEEGRIEAIQDEVNSPARRLHRGGLYTPPSQTRLSPTMVGGDEVRALLTKEDTVGRAFGRNVGLPRKYVAELLARLGLDEKSPSEVLFGREEEAGEVLRDMVAQAGNDPTPCICISKGSEEIFAFPPQGLEVKRRSASVSELCDELFLDEAGTEVEIAPDPGERKKLELEATIARLRKESESHLVEARALREKAGSAKGMTVEEAQSLLKELGAAAKVRASSPQAVGSAIYDMAKELEVRSAEALEAAEKLEKRFVRMEVPAARKKKPLDLRKREWYEKFRWFFTSEGKLAIGGRDAQTNSVLVGRHLDDTDTIYHADLFGSPFFILKQGKEQTEAEVRQVAQATVSFSSAWKTGLGAADAFWVLPEQVKTAAPSGEYLSRGSFAITGKKNFVSRNIVEVAVGLDREGRVEAGPEEAVKGRVRTYVVVAPHREKSSETAKRVFRDIVSGSDSSSITATLDDVVKALPTGGGRVVRRKVPREGP